MSKIVKMSVVLEHDDGHTMTFEVTGYREDPLRGEVSLNCEPEEDLDAMEEQGWMWRVMKPGPVSELTLRAVGVIEARRETL